MIQIGTIQLQPSTILSVPIQTYERDFTFIVNGEEYKTSRLVSDLISPVICRIHSSDPTIDRFTINTHAEGDFNKILNLANFDQNNLSTSETDFISEVLKIIGNENVKFQSFKGINELTLDSVLNDISLHERNSYFYSDYLSTEIKFISSHFSELCKFHEDELIKLSISTLIKIINNDHFQLNSEDDFLHFVNNIYKKDREFSFMYENVIFSNASSKYINEFLNCFDWNDMTGGIWSSLSKRLEIEISNNMNELSQRYKKQKQKQKADKICEYSFKKKFDGIINYLIKKSENKIENEIRITSSSVVNSSEDVKPQNVVLFDDNQKWFCSSNNPNSWIKFEFLNSRVELSNYTIKTRLHSTRNSYMKSWIVEGSNDDVSWEVLDERSNCGDLNGGSIVHTFDINKKNSNEFKYIRISLTGPCWNESYNMVINSIELYGKIYLIEN